MGAPTLRDCIQASVRGPDVGRVEVFPDAEAAPGVPPFPAGMELHRYRTDTIVPERVADDGDLVVVVDLVRRGRHVAVLQVVLTGFGVGPDVASPLEAGEAALLRSLWERLPAD